MSDKEKLWASYVAKYPSFAEPGNVTLSAAGLRRLFDLTYETAQDNISLTEVEKLMRQFGMN